jgi:hypothetical protein
VGRRVCACHHWQERGRYHSVGLPRWHRILGGVATLAFYSAHLGLLK